MEGAIKFEKRLPSHFTAICIQYRLQNEEEEKMIFKRQTLIPNALRVIHENLGALTPVREG